MPVEVTLLENASAEWDGYVAAAPDACIYHDARWKNVIEETFHHRCHYLLASRQGRAAGVLPLVEIRSPWFGRYLVSLPFLTYGGVLAEDGQAADALAQAAIGLCRETGARWVELRQRGEAALDWASRRHKVALVVPVEAGAESLWTHLGSRLRGKVRKAQRSGGGFEVLGGEGTRSFYLVFSRNMRDLGTPVYPLRFFEAIGRHFAAETRVFLVSHGGRITAAAFGLGDRDCLQLPWICSDYRYSGNYWSEFLYWSIIEWAAGHGYRLVDFGRSTAGSGNYRFKKQWNPEEIPLAWYYWARNDEGPPGLSPDNPRFSLAIRLWRRLPLPVANLLGPPIVRYLP
ncbi:MAG: FemAB family XrtA/PEP-CTERM system-associated protein [Bryobacteraceae bacterium]